MKTLTWLLLGVLIPSQLLLAIAIGAKAPDFSLKNQDGKDVSLGSLKGKIILMYFYPKDETPGCTKEACALRDAYAPFQKAGAVVLGVSSQDAKSHQEFKANHKLPFDLLVDSDGAVAAKFGVGKMPGMGLLERKSVLIGPDSKVVRFYDSVKPNEHAAEVLKDIEHFQAKASPTSSAN